MKRKFFCIITCFCMILLISGCGNQAKYMNYDFDKNIDFCDYKNVVIEKSFTQIDESDVLAIINLDFSSNNYFQETQKTNICNGDFVLLSVQSDSFDYNYDSFFYEIGSGTLTEAFDNNLIGKGSNEIITFTLDGNSITVCTQGIFSIADASDPKTVTSFYGMESMQEVEAFLRERARKEITWNYLWDYILENTVVTEYPDEIMSAMSEELDSLRSIAQSNDLSIEEYLKQFETSLEEIEASIEKPYRERLIIDALLIKENLSVEAYQIEDKKQEIMQTNNLSKEDYALYYSDEDVFYDVAVELLQTALIDYVQIVE